MVNKSIKNASDTSSIRRICIYLSCFCPLEVPLYTFGAKTRHPAVFSAVSQLVEKIFLDKLKVVWYCVSDYLYFYWFFNIFMISSVCYRTSDVYYNDCNLSKRSRVSQKPILSAFSKIVFLNTILHYTHWKDYSRIFEENSIPNHNLVSKQCNFTLFRLTIIVIRMWYIWHLRKKED